MPFNGPSPDKLYDTFQMLELPMGKRLGYHESRLTPLDEIGEGHSLVIVSFEEGIPNYGVLEVHEHPYGLVRKRAKVELPDDRLYHVFPKTEEYPAEMLVGNPKNPEEDFRTASKLERLDARYLLLHILRSRRVHAHRSRIFNQQSDE